ncbi:hypothetical protein [Rhizobium sp. C4]|uniref:hypothetical protein n=1 Tax=Rhizobium sp. C4 TaxID=1349800 RepID=UPI001E5E15F9|nr:hypothetical protein [Rhizobium sp. C4]MCD2171832.1 hypothetical protein [Rhizobium sp. C4]
MTRLLMIPVVTMTAMLALAGCQRGDATEPLKLSGKLFIFNYRISKATYNLAFDFQGKIPDGSYVEASFENPAGGEPLKITQKIFPFWEKLALESPPLRCVVKDKPYRVAVSLFGPDANKIQTVETTVISSLDQTILPKNSIVVGPAYDMNPKVFVKGGEADYSPDTDCPKA